MTTKYTFKLKNNPSTFYTPNYKSTDYSKILDDLINDDIMEKNFWLGSTTKKNSDTIKIKLNGKPYSYNNNDAIVDAIIKDSKKDDFEKACAFFNNYGKLKKSPFIKDKIYYLDNGTPFYITDDYITIGFETFYFYEFGSLENILAKLGDNMKKTICEIFIDGLKITIKK